MNFNSPAQCNGTVTQWNYCFYGTGSAGEVFGVKFMVYRSNNVAGVYDRVNNSLYYLKMNYEQLPTFGIGCSAVTLNSSQQFQILQNDIIAACIVESDSDGINPLNVTSYFADKAYRVDVGCTDDSLNSIDTNLDSSGFNRQNILLLHASIINMNSECIVTYTFIMTIWYVSLIVC